MTTQWPRRTVLGLLATAAFVPRGHAETVIRIVWPTPGSLGAAAAPIGVAQQLGWFADAGIRVQLVTEPGSADVVKRVATGDLLYGIASVEAVVSQRLQGLKAKTFYTYNQGNMYGLAVPADGPIQSIADLRDKRIGVAAIGSVTVPIARVLVADAGLKPDADVRFVVVGSGVAAAPIVRNHEVDALSLYDTAYAAIEDAGVKLRYLDRSKIEHFPGLEICALEKTIAERRDEAVAIGRALAKGTIFTLNNPEAAVRLLLAAFPEQAAPTNIDEAARYRFLLGQIRASKHIFNLEQANVTRWGESNLSNFDAYLDFLLKNGVLKQTLPASDVVTNELIDEINKFDAAAVAAMAKSYRS